MMVLRRRWLLKIVICDKHALDTAVSSTTPPHHQSTTTTSTIIPRTLARRLTAVDCSPAELGAVLPAGGSPPVRSTAPLTYSTLVAWSVLVTRWAITSRLGEAPTLWPPRARPTPKEARAVCVTKDVNQMRAQTPRTDGAALAQLVNAHRRSMTQLQQVKNIRGRAASCSFHCGTAPSSVTVMISAKPSLPWGSWVS